MSTQKANSSNETTIARIKRHIRLPLQVTVELENNEGKERVNVNITDHNMPLLLAVKLVLMRNLPHIFHEGDEDWAHTRKQPATEPASPEPPAGDKPKGKKANEPIPDLPAAETA